MDINDYMNHLTSLKAEFVEINVKNLHDINE